MTIKVTYNVTDVYVTQDVSPVYINVSYSTGTSGGSAVWGGITGTLSNQTDLQSALDLKVPYTGATANVNLGEYEIKAGQVTLDTSPTGTAAVGTTRWNDTLGSTETTLKGGSVILKNGVDLVARIVNKVTPNTTLTKAAYQAVRVSGAQGQRLAVAFAQANNDNNSADTIGLVTETIATNQEGFIITVGQLENINTTGSLQGETWADGDVLYLSPTTAGALTNVKPNATIGHIVVIGYVEYAHANNGKIYVKVMNGWELDELHDVSITSVANNEALIYESSTALWKNKSIATALGYTPEQPLTFNSPLSRSVNAVSIPQATGSVNGFLSSTDWTTFNNKQNALGYTPANAATTLTINGVTFDLSTSRTFTVGSVTGSGASGQVAYWTGASAQSGSNNLFWDAAQGRLGIGTNVPSSSIHISGFNTTNSQFRLGSLEFQSYGLNNGWFGNNVYYNGTNFIRRATGTAEYFYFFNGSGQFRFAPSGNAGTTITNGVNGAGLIPFVCDVNGDVFIGGDIDVLTNTSGGLNVKGNTRNVLINSTTDTGERLQVTGNTKILGAASTNASNGLAVLNSSAVATFSVRNDGRISNGDSSFYVDRYTVGGTVMTISTIGHNGATGISVTGSAGIRAYSNLGISVSNLLGASIYAAGGANVGNISLGILSNRALITATASGMAMHVSSMLQVDSTNQGFLPPRMTTTQKTAIATPAAGLVVYDTTLNKLCVYTTTWETITSV